MSAPALFTGVCHRCGEYFNSADREAKLCSPCWVKSIDSKNDDLCASGLHSSPSPHGYCRDCGADLKPKAEAGPPPTLRFHWPTHQRVTLDFVLEPGWDCEISFKQSPPPPF